MHWITQKGSGVYNQVPEGIEKSEKLPQGVYTIRFIPNKGYQVEERPAFKFPSVIYGDVNKRVNRVLKAFRAEDSNVGVLLMGLKGTGKSLTARKLAEESKLPVIIIDADYTGDPNFFSYISGFTQEVVFFFDEFEKVFRQDEGGQERLLTLLDGTSSSKYLFVLTGNERDRINPYFKNRPGRIRYYWEYKGLEDDVINDIIDRVLKKKEHEVDLKAVIENINNKNMTFDKLISFVEEVNLFGDDYTPRELINGFNVGVGEETRDYNLVLNIHGKEYTGQCRANFIDFDGSVEGLHLDRCPRAIGSMIDDDKWPELVTIEISERADQLVHIRNNIKEGDEAATAEYESLLNEFCDKYGFKRNYHQLNNYSTPLNAGEYHYIGYSDIFSTGDVSEENGVITYSNPAEGWSASFVPKKKKAVKSLYTTA
jgi:hypothetical protein